LETGAADFAFLVPTPVPPKLAEADEKTFGFLQRAVQARTYNIGCAKEDDAVAGSAPATKDDPVLSVSLVAGYEATVLSLANPSIAANWLKARNFPISAASKEWLDSYAVKHWVVTAFRVASANGEGQLKPIRLTFPTDRPFYPYREPATQTKSSDKPWRNLQLFILADAPYRGTMGGEAWVGQETVCDQLKPEELQQIQETLPDVDLSNCHWLTALRDNSYPRIGKEDVVFTPYFQIPASWVKTGIGILGIGTIGSIAVWRRSRRRRSA